MALDVIRPRFLLSRHGVPLVGRRPAIIYDCNTKVTVEVVMRLPEGEVRDLSTFGTPSVADDLVSGEYRVVATAFEAARGSSEYAFQETCTVTDAAEGTIQFELATSAYPGVYRCEIHVEDSEDFTLAVYKAYVYINPTFRGSETWRSFPVYDEFRLGIRDSMPEDNLLIDELDYCGAEICEAIVRAVQRWNELPPQMEVFGTHNFPYRGSLIEGAKSQLYIMAAEWYRRNRLPHAAGNFQVDDLNKAQEYEQIGRMGWDEYTKWVRGEKARQNREQSFFILP